MSKSKKRAAADTSAQVPAGTTNIARTNWEGLRDTGLSLMQGSITSKAIATQSLAASCLAFVTQRSITYKHGDGTYEGNADTLATYFDTIVLGAKGEDRKAMGAFRNAVIDGMMPTAKPEKPTNKATGKAINSISYQQESEAWQAQRRVFNAPFDLACALAKRDYDAGDFVVGEGFNILRQDIVPRSFSLVTTNVHRPQKADDVICLNFASVVHKGKLRDDQFTLISDKDGEAFISHSVAEFIAAQRPPKDNAKKTLNLFDVFKYIIGLSSDTVLEGKLGEMARDSIIKLTGIQEHNAKLNAAGITETDGKGNVKAA